MRLLAIMLFAACGSRDAETASNPEPSSNESSSAEGAQGETASAPVEAPMDPGPVPVIDLQSVEDEGLFLQVRAVDPVELRRSVRIERQSGDSWEPAEAEYNLRTDCEETSGECLMLAAGAELSSPALNLSTGQCGGAELAPGTYRFVVQSCAPEGARPHEIHSVFSLDP